MERLQRLQEIQEQVWQQAALDLRLYKQMEVTLPSPVPTVLSDLPAVKTEPVSDVSPAAAEPTSLLSSSTVTGDCLCVDGFCCENVHLLVIECEKCNENCDLYNLCHSLNLRTHRAYPFSISHRKSL